MAEAAVAGLAYALKNVAEGAALLAKGIYDRTQPLKATLRPVVAKGKGELATATARARHSIAIVKGRAYIFGGVVAPNSGEEDLADNDVHVVILPTTDFDSVDYKRVLSSSSGVDVPASRAGHAVAVIDDRIYVFGGSDEKGNPLDEQGLIWIFDTTQAKWSSLSPSGPPDAPRPSPRTAHSAVASEHPRAPSQDTYAAFLPQNPPEPGSALPEPPAANSYGTFLVQGGLDSTGATLNDLWSFDINTRTWRELPSPPAPITGGSSLALSPSGKRIYSFAGAQTSFLDVTDETADPTRSPGLSANTPWLAFSLPPSAAPTAEEQNRPHPGSRTGAALVPVTTGQGRNYLLLIGGMDGEVVKEDLWALQLPAEELSAAAIKDRARDAVGLQRESAAWAEVRYFDSEGVMVQEGQEGRGVDSRRGFAAARGEEVDGGSVVVWGGIGAGGRARGDGVVVSVE